MPRKQTKHETEKNNIKFMVWLLFSILSDFDLIVVFNVIFFPVPRMGFVINILPLFFFFAGFLIQLSLINYCFFIIIFSSHNCAYIANT